MTRRFDRALIPPSPTLEFEAALWADGSRLVAGVDEAGRGALAGPVAAGAVILPPCEAVPDCLLEVRDSKEMRPSQRQQAAIKIETVALAWQVGWASAAEIDELGIVPATRLAAERAITGLAQPPQHLLIDALLLPEVACPQTSLIKGDARALSIACASVLAKVARDRLLVDRDKKYPGYGFAAHKGYGTVAHKAALAALGPCDIHRYSFAPLRAA